MTKYNHSFAKMVDGLMEWGPIPLTVVTHHHEEWDEPVFDPETEEPVIDPETGEQKTERMSRDWDTSERKLRPTSTDYAQMGYLTVVDEPPSDPAPDGYHWEAKGWNEGEHKVVRVYEAVENPPRTFSKLRLYAALAHAGLWDGLKAWLEAQTYEGLNAYTAFTLAQDITDAHPMFRQWFAAAKAALGVSDADAEAILAASLEEDD